MRRNGTNVTPKNIGLKDNPVGKGSRNRTKSFKKYWEADYWRKGKKNEKS